MSDSPMTIINMVPLAPDRNMGAITSPKPPIDKVTHIRVERRPRSASQPPMGMVSPKNTTPNSCITELLAVVAQRRGAPGEREDRHQIEENECGQRHHRPYEHSERMLAENGPE